MKNVSQYTAWSLILGAILINIPYLFLGFNFNYPAILRQPTGHILTQFSAGGAPLILQWLAFSWCGFPILFGMLGLYLLLKQNHPFYTLSATVMGIAGLFFQMVGLLRWVFVVPALAESYRTGSEIQQEIAMGLFNAVHRYGGVVIGEHLGQSLTLLWMVGLSRAMVGSPHFKVWHRYWGYLSALVYALAQTELLHLVLPVPIIDTGLIGSLLWLSWLIILGQHLLKRTSQKPLNSTLLAPRSVATWFLKTGLTGYFALPIAQIPAESLRLYGGIALVQGLNNAWNVSNTVTEGSGVLLDGGLAWKVWQGLELRLGLGFLAGFDGRTALNPMPGIGYAIAF